MRDGGVLGNSVLLDIFAFLPHSTVGTLKVKYGINKDLSGNGWVRDGGVTPPVLDIWT